MKKFLTTLSLTLIMISVTSVSFAGEKKSPGIESKISSESKIEKTTIENFSIPAAVDVGIYTFKKSPEVIFTINNFLPSPVLIYSDEDFIKDYKVFHEANKTFDKTVHPDSEKNKKAMDAARALMKKYPDVSERIERSKQNVEFKKVFCTNSTGAYFGCIGGCSFMKRDCGHYEWCLVYYDICMSSCTPCAND